MVGKSIPDIRSMIDDLNRDQNLESNKMALPPVFEGATESRTQRLLQQIDFVNVIDSVGPSQSPS